MAKKRPIKEHKWKLILESLEQEFSDETEEEKRKMLDEVASSFFDPTADIILIQEAEDIACTEECETCEDWQNGDACMLLRRTLFQVLHKLIDHDKAIKVLSKELAGEEITEEDEEDITITGKGPERLEDKSKKDAYIS
jgi:hypothetical protein